MYINKSREDLPVSPFTTAGSYLQTLPLGAEVFDQVVSTPVPPPLMVDGELVVAGTGAVSYKLNLKLTGLSVAAGELLRQERRDGQIGLIRRCPPNLKDVKKPRTSARDVNSGIVGEGPPKC
jgi:predicted secreted protein